MEPAHSSEERPADGSGQTILVVDDEVIVRMLVVELLEEAGYATLEAQDGATALRALEEAGSVDLLVTDIGLPGSMSGRQLANAARARIPGLGVLFVTGYADTQLAGDSAPESNEQVVPKPFAGGDLLKRVAELLTASGS